MASLDSPQTPDWLTRGTSEIFPNQPESKNPQENLAQLLATTDRPLRVKLGIDPTAGDIHLGHSIPFRKLRAFQDAGHTAVVIIGDFTAQIGDPTGKSEVRRQLTGEEVKENAKDYLNQLRPILDFETPGRLEIRYNSEWLSKLNLAEIQELLSTMTVGQMLAKEGFAERYNEEKPIYLHEFLYPLMQGYDSVMVEADVELGGTDQKFNIAVGRDLQRHFGKKPQRSAFQTEETSGQTETELLPSRKLTEAWVRPQFGLLLPILIGTDGGQKMSKSLGNYIGLKEDALSMYSKLEKTPDALIKDYFELLTDLPLEQLPDDPRECQKRLALEIVSQYHGEEAAKQAQKTAINVITKTATVGLGVEVSVSKKVDFSTLSAIPEHSLKEVKFPAKLFYILNASGLCQSSSEGRRQIQDKAVRLDGDRITDVDLTFDNPEQLQGKVLQVGKKKFIRLIF